MHESAAAKVRTWLTGVCPDWTPFPALTVVYRLFSHDGTLLYIGYTIDLQGRFVRHFTHSKWFRPAEVQLITFEEQPSLEAARAAEKAAIKAECPKYNIAGTPRDHRLGPRPRRRVLR